VRQRAQFTAFAALLLPAIVTGQSATARYDVILRHGIIVDGTAFDDDAPRPLFESGYVNAPHNPINYFPYSVSADGQRFLIPRPTVDSVYVSSPITVVMNWTAALKK
jgi:hypothetical protein